MIAILIYHFSDTLQKTNKLITEFFLGCGDTNANPGCQIGNESDDSVHIVLLIVLANWFSIFDALQKDKAAKTKSFSEYSSIEPTEVQTSELTLEQETW